MPLHKNNGEKFPLKNEMTEKDFEWKKREWFYASFSSPEYFPTHEDDANKMALSGFLNGVMSGPFYVIEGGMKPREILSLVVFHPDDWKICKKILVQDKWKAKPDSIAKNMAIIREQIDAGFEYENPSMLLLLHFAKKEMMENGGLLKRENIDQLMRKIWAPHPV